MKPVLARHVRLTYSQARKRPVLLLPETVVVLNDTGAAILELCDGQHTVDGIVAELAERYRTVPRDEVTAFLGQLAQRRCLEGVIRHG